MASFDIATAYADKARFAEACRDVCGKERQAGGIGTLSEKTLHAVIKKFIEPDERFHEVSVSGSIADVKNAEGIFEVQTRAFNKLRGKLRRFLAEGPVTVVYPIPAEKRLIWVDAGTGAVSAPRKSPKKGRSYDAIDELYKLDRLIAQEGLRILLLFIDMDEYRILGGGGSAGKRRSTRYERIPEGLSGALLLCDGKDYAERFLPPALPVQFTSRDLAASARISQRLAQTTLTVLTKRGAVGCVGKSGRLNLYEVLSAGPTPARKESLCKP